MKPTQSINYRYITVFFIIFFLCAVVGFWNSYFIKIFAQESYRMHTHGIALILWLALLIIQPYLIRAKKVRLHKTLGKFSYLLVPILVLTSLDLFKYSLSKMEQLGNIGYCFVALIAFLIFYGLAIYHKRKANIHARYMVCTAFPMFTPITDRIISNYFPSLVAYVPTIDTTPVVLFIGFLMADLILVGLCIWDVHSNKRWNVFPPALLVLLFYHFSVLNFYKYPFWQSFCEWFHAI